MPPIGMALVGAGYFGPHLLRNAQQVPELRVRAVCDLDADRARAVVGPYSTIEVTDSFSRILDDPEIEAVAIATPAATHFDLARAALEAGKHVLVEKPITASLAEGEKLVELAEESGRVLMCDHTLCYTPVVQRIRELVHGGEIGEVLFVDAVRINLGLVQPDVDVIWDLAPHDLSVFDFVLPPGVRPVAVAAHGADPIGAERACVAYLSVWLSNGAIAHVHLNWLSPTKIRTTVIGGSRRTIIWDDVTPGRRLAVYDRGVDRIPAADLDEGERTRARVAYRVGDIHIPALPETEALRGVMAEFAAAIGSGRPALTDGWAGLRVLQLLTAADESLRSGGAIVRIEGHLEGHREGRKA
ncbi:Gfo/Idh/MocA family oxidoreductase [Planomonospora sp. ID67723]|uniref:Gfo/Idh/MocA family protein n=1 Tax=Planomonospora sp. ID67723 TaxID=2738134 RepID=UPI0018C3F6AB|nr:Gfo/Idh/MocA family oxidoreductase [Planomonospora sp. ID67723]MBG0827439.1 Gfo/Idh/MocA family oxidoreductase [Planomonospora sp. ID67723]